MERLIQRPGGRVASPYLVLAVSSMAMLLTAIDSTMVATGLATLTGALHTTVAWSSWVISGYLLGQTMAMPVAGRLSDSLGRRPMFLVYVLVFTLASLGSGLSSSIFMLIGFRVVEAIGGGGFMPSALGVVADQFGRDRDRAVGLLATVFPLGAMVGPALGGVIVTYFSWRVIFFVNVPLGALLFLLLSRVLPHQPPKGGRIDLMGAALLSAALLCLMLGLNELGTRGASSAPAWLLLALSIAATAVFLLQQERSPHPILPLVLLKHRGFVVVNGLNVVFGAAALGIFSFVPLFAEVQYGLSPLAAGGLLTLRAAGMGAFAVVVAFAMGRTGYRIPMLAGFLGVAVGLAMMFVPPQHMPAFWWLAIGSALAGSGVGAAAPAANNAALQLMPDQVAAIGGLRGMFRQIGGITSVSLAALAMSANGNRASVLQYVFVALALIAVASAPFIAGVPERARGEGSSSRPLTAAGAR
jgi:EmrB/QacA subfamily drug resistance transporter